MDPIQVRGKVTNIVGLVVEGHGPGSSMGGHVRNLFQGKKELHHGRGCGLQRTSVFC
ncbi:MAG: hypothetical protein MZU91_02960 [Desulfosudis oleivorans]|nr:hypothetical protein [Desulfosudis oleivorans]